MRYAQQMFSRLELFSRSFGVAHASSEDGKCFVTPSLICKRRICAPGQPDSAPNVYKTRWTDRLHCLVDVFFDAPAAAAARASLTVLPRRGSLKDARILKKRTYALDISSYDNKNRALLTYCTRTVDCRLRVQRCTCTVHKQLIHKKYPFYR
jgi:hypothetical protein